MMLAVYVYKDLLKSPRIDYLDLVLIPELVNIVGSYYGLLHREEFISRLLQESEYAREK